MPTIPIGSPVRPRPLRFAPFSLTRARWQVARQGTLMFALLAAMLSCADDATGPGGRSGGMARLAFEPRFPSALAGAPLSQLEPFDRVRVTLADEAGVVRYDTVVAFPAGAAEVRLGAEFPLPPSATGSSVAMFLSLRYVNAQGDTVFRGGPTRVVVSTVRGAPEQPISIDVAFSGVGSTASRVELAPAGGTVLAGTTTDFTASAFNPDGTPVPGARAVFETPEAGLALIASPTEGRVVWGNARGSVRIIATLLNGVADTAAFTITLPAARLALVSGQGQSASIGKALASPVVFRVEAADGIPVAGVPVTFAVTTGGGTLSSASAVSDVNGQVSTVWTLGELIGEQVMQASVAGLTGSPVSVAATGLDRLASALAFTASPSASVAGTEFAPVVVAVRDADGIVVTSFNGGVTVTLDPGSVGGTGATLVSPTGGVMTVMAVAGVATFPGLRVNRAGSDFRLLATAGAIASAVSPPFTVSPAAPAALAITSGNGQTGTVGSIAPVALGVRLRDAFDNGIAGATISFAVTAGAASVAPATVTTDANGNASAQLTLGDLAGTVTVRATAVATPALFVDFTATAAAAGPFALQHISGGGDSYLIGTATAAPYTVRVVDALGNPTAGVEVVWAIVLGDGTLSDTLTTTDDQGYASVVLSLPPETIGPIVVTATAGDLVGSPQVFTTTVFDLPPVAAPRFFVADVSLGVRWVNLEGDTTATAVSCIVVGCSEPRNLAINGAGTLIAVPFRFSNAIGLINPSTGLQTANIADASFNEPYAAAFNAAGTEVWVANKFGGGSDTGTVSIVDVASQSVVAVVEHASILSPEGIAIAGGRAWVANRNGNSVTVIDVGMRTVLTSIALPGSNQPRYAVGTPDGSLVYVSTSTNRVFKINTSDLTVTQVDLPSGRSRNLAVHPDGGTVYAALQNSQIAVINVLDNTVTTIGFEVASSTYAVAISADGSLGFVTDENLGTVLVFNPATNDEVFSAAFPVTGFFLPRAIVAK
jgi:hypothetical protein